MTVIHIVKFVVKLLLFIVFLPILLPFILVRLLCYRAVLVRNMVKSGMPEEYAKMLANETKLRTLIK